MTCAAPAFSSGSNLSATGRHGPRIAALTSQVVNRMRDKGVLISACAMGHNVLKIRPPLVLSADQAGLVIKALDEALGEAQRPVRRLAPRG